MAGAGGLPRRLKLLAMSASSHAAALCASQGPPILDIASPWRGNLTAPERSELGESPLKSPLGTYAYHFWMMPMQPIKRCSGDQNLVDKSEPYRRAVARKMDAYHRYVQLGCIAQGLLQHLAINFRAVVWAKFRSWLRTMRKDLVPSEMVVALALKSCFPEFLLERTTEPELKKFILDHAECDKIPGMSLAA